MLEALQDNGGLKREPLAQHATHFNSQKLLEPEEERTDL